MDAVCLFCRIVGGEIPADKVHEDDAVLAFRDINTQASTNILVIPKQHIDSAADLAAPDTDAELVRRLLSTVADLADREGLRRGWRVVSNVGPDGGQSVQHLHFHLLGGRRMTWPPG